MKKLSLRALAGVMIAALVGLFVAGPSFGYPDPPADGIDFDLSATTIESGDDVTVTASAGGEAGTFTTSLFGETSSGSGTSHTSTFTAPEVDEPTEYTGTGTFVPDEAPAAFSGGLVSAVEVQSTFSVTVVPEGYGTGSDGDASGALPGTGSSVNAFYIVGAIALIIGGAVALIVARRRNAT